VFRDGEHPARAPRRRKQAPGILLPFFANTLHSEGAGRSDTTAATRFLQPSSKSPIVGGQYLYRELKTSHLGSHDEQIGIASKSDPETGKQL